MEKIISLCYCEVTLDYDKKLSATQLRSFVGYKFVGDSEFHHHDDLPFHYPTIQYKRIREKLYVLGMSESANLVFDRMSGLQSVTLYQRKIPVVNIIFKKSKFTITSDITMYHFTSPWIALNSDNYTKYKNMDKQFRKHFLEDILIGNLLSMLKGLRININYKLYVELKWYKEIPVVAHKHTFSGFYAKFVTNLSLPDYIGIGKSVSKGFGITEKIK